MFCYFTNYSPFISPILSTMHCTSKGNFNWVSLWVFRIKIGETVRHQRLTETEGTTPFFLPLRMSLCVLVMFHSWNYGSLLVCWRVSLPPPTCTWLSGILIQGRGRILLVQGFCFHKKITFYPLKNSVCAHGRTFGWGKRTGLFGLLAAGLGCAICSKRKK